MKTPVQAEDWLSVLLWGAETILFPSFRNLTQGYETWNYQQRRFKQHFGRLEKRQFIKRKQQDGHVVYHLTRLGRVAALGGRNPEERWRRKWDGKWRMVVFDLPVSHQNIRQRFLRWLRQNGFGYLQDSVWIHTDPVTDLTEALAGFRDDVESLTILEAQCCAGYSNAAFVNGAWPFEEINRRYRDYLDVAVEELPTVLKSQDAVTVMEWLHRERFAWKQAVVFDPLLPRQLHPPGYLGEHAWAAKRRALEKASRLIT